MKLILVRHGEASAVDGHKILTDKQRTLTQRGLIQAQETANAVLSEHTPDMLIVSPYIRALQTMQAFESILNKRATIYNHITPLDDEIRALDFISDLAEEQSAQCVLVVCHMDIVARLYARATASNFISFGLAEARVCEQTIIAEGIGTHVKNYVPIA